MVICNHIFCILLVFYYNVIVILITTEIEIIVH